MSHEASKCGLKGKAQTHAYIVTAPCMVQPAPPIETCFQGAVVSGTQGRHFVPG